MEKEFRIEAATSDDIEGLIALYGELSPDDVPILPIIAAEKLRAIERIAGSVVLVGKVNEIAVSTCTLIIIPNLTRSGASYGLVENVVTARAQRGNGYAKAVLGEAASRAWKADCYKVMLMTGMRDDGTLRFYERAGFSQTKTGFQMRRIPMRAAT